MKKRLWAGLLVLCLLFACYSIGASEEVFNQQSGDYDYLPLADGTARLVKYYGSEADLVVPAELDGLKVTEIADSAFSWNDDIERVTLPEGVEKIGSQLFAYSTFLEAVTLPSTLKEIGSNPFIGCDEALDITILGGILELKDGVLFNRETHTLICYPEAMEEASYVIHIAYDYKRVGRFTTYYNRGVLEFADVTLIDAATGKKVGAVQEVRGPTAKSLETAKITSEFVSGGPPDEGEIDLAVDAALERALGLLAEGAK